MSTLVRRRLLPILRRLAPLPFPSINNKTNDENNFENLLTADVSACSESFGHLWIHPDVVVFDKFDVALVDLHFNPVFERCSDFCVNEIDDKLNFNEKLEIREKTQKVKKVTRSVFAIIKTYLSWQLVNLSLETWQIGVGRIWVVVSQVSHYLGKCELLKMGTCKMFDRFCLDAALDL